MEKDYKCPYCGQNKYAKASDNKGNFTNWKSVRNHTSTCKKRTGIYFIDINEGPIHYSNFINKNYKQIKDKYINIKANMSNIKVTFKRRNIDIGNINIKYSDKDLIYYIQKFVKNNNKIPISRDFKKNPNYPHEITYEVRFGSWNKAIEAAGFEPNINSGYGLSTLANDNHLYRSRLEANFADKFLHNKYKYIIEPRYPKPYNKIYDWYISELDLYIELDGGIRPEVIKEKIEINKKLNRKLLVVIPKDLNKFNNLQELYDG